MNNFNLKPQMQPLSEVVKGWSRRGGIYLIQCTQTKKTYLGSTQNIIKRLKDHWKQLITNQHPNQEMQLDFNQWGEQSFWVGFVKLVHQNYDRKQLYLDEQDYLDVVKSFETRYYNKSHKCKEKTQTHISKPVQAFIKQHVDPYDCARLTWDTFEVDGQTKTVISYQFQDRIPHYHTIHHYTKGQPPTPALPLSHNIAQPTHDILTTSQY